MQELQEYLEQMELKLDNEFLAMQILQSASSSYVKSSQTRLAFGLPVVLNGASMDICLTGTAASWYTEHVLCMHAWFVH